MRLVNHFVPVKDLIVHISITKMAFIDKARSECGECCKFPGERGEESGAR